MTPLQSKPVTSVGSLFLDSGAHSLYTKYVMKAKGYQKWKHDYGWYETHEFWDYVDSYAKFVIKYKRAIDYYVNVDVIFNPELSWKVLKYLEDEWGLRPLPVIHFGTDLKWLHKHLDAGYEFIGIGGLGQEATRHIYTRWADGMFRVICPGPNFLPTVRTHGFAMTAYGLMIRYPWFSVDSAAWTKVGAYGGILVPHKRGGEFTFARQPYKIDISVGQPSAKLAGQHYSTLRKEEQSIVLEWLGQIGIPLGKTKPNGDVIEYGVTNRHSERKAANLLFFEAMRKSLPKYPWPFKGTKTPSFGLR